MSNVTTLSTTTTTTTTTSLSSISPTTTSTTTNSLTFSVTGTTKSVFLTISNKVIPTEVYETYTVTYPRPIAVASSSKLSTVFMLLLLSVC